MSIGQDGSLHTMDDICHQEATPPNNSMYPTGAFRPSFTPPTPHGRTMSMQPCLHVCKQCGGTCIKSIHTKERQIQSLIDTIWELQLTRMMALGVRKSDKKAITELNYFSPSDLEKLAKLLYGPNQA
jgi:hypothetical protein